MGKAVASLCSGLCGASPRRAVTSIQDWSARRIPHRLGPPRNPRGRLAFTLIELLVVIAIIGVLAALLFPAGAAIKRKAVLKRAETELTQVEIAIERYKTDKGFYPPDNSANKVLSDSGKVDQLYSVADTPAKFNSLFYELCGVKTKGADFSTYYTLNDIGSISKADLASVFGVGGVMNLSSGGDEGTVAKNFIKEFKPSQYLTTAELGPQVTVLGTALRGPVMWSNANGDEINPWRYVSAAPYHNTETVDLWVDVLVGNKTNRVSNWSEKPEIVN